MNPTIQAKWIVLSERVYAALLILYPVEYRREYGRLMLQLFRDVTRERYRAQGVAGVALWWCRTLCDLALTALEQRRKVRFIVSKATFVQLTGILLILGGVLGALAAFSQFQPDDHYTYHGIYQIFILLLGPAYLLIGLGCIGLTLGYDKTFGKVGQWMMVLTAFGSLVMAVGLVASRIQESLWAVWMVGGILHTVGLTGFGLLHLRKPMLPMFRAFPLMLASGWVVMVLGLLRTTSQTANNTLMFLFVFGLGLGWLAIGQVVNRQRRAAALAAA
jgi:hypothetical protein